MLSSNRWLKRALVFALVALVAVSPGAGAKDGEKDQEKAQDSPVSKPSDQATRGWIVAPTHDAARLFSPMAARGVTHYLVHATPEAQFLLVSTESSHISSCALGVCFTTGDFDVLFFHDNGDGTTSVTGRFNSVGSDSGQVPPNTSFGLVYMKTPGMDPRVKGFEFLYVETSQ